jgi:carbonic anhydrase/acetyltransferase-like protein (isoleucine patch superfamily)
MSRFTHRIATSDHGLARFARSTYWGIRSFSLPAPSILVRPALAIVLAIRSVYYFLVRVLICEPLFKAYCESYGVRVHTGVFLHWVQGRGRIVLGDDVVVDGKCSFSFANRYDPHPTLTVGSNTGIGHNCTFIVAKSITIGEHCRIGTNVLIFDASGHPSDPNTRLRGDPAPANSIKPVTIARNVWIGHGATIFPGVTIGENSVISAGAVVVSPVEPNSLMLGNPARRMATL